MLPTLDNKDLDPNSAGPGIRSSFALPSPALVAKVQAEAQALEGKLIALRREFHSHPELGWQEFHTTARIADELAAMGLALVKGHELLGTVARLGLTQNPKPGEGDTGCLARLDTGRPGPTVCLRVDIDALPIDEAAEGHRPQTLGFSSTRPGIMHACGHDGHIAIGLGVARILTRLQGDLGGTMLILFQPAEEGVRGAAAVVEAGLLDEVDLFIAAHIGFGVRSHVLALGVGGFLATRKFSVALAGKASHAGKAPEDGRNALLAACSIIPGLHGLAQSSVPGTRVNVGVLQGGTSLNIVPDRATFEFEIRCVNETGLADLDARCRRMIEGVAAAHEVSAQIELRGMAGSWVNPKEFVNWAGAINQASGTFPAVLTDYNFGASEDATNLAAAVASHGGLAGIMVLGADLADAHHTPHFDFDEGVLTRGAEILALLAASALQGSTNGKRQEGAS
jgi:aminobenzoyl-glutamate utilization protein A